MSTYSNSLLIRNAGHAFSGHRVDVRVRGGVITALATALPSIAGEQVIDADGAALLPGLHDHHIHLQALATAATSIKCDPRSVMDGRQLAEQLQAAATTGAATEWLRGIGYHESVAGDIDRDWLDRHVPHRPVRIQHRSGRLWIFNSCALRLLHADEPTTPFERRGGCATGRLFDSDAWLRGHVHNQRPSLAAVSRQLASHGVTGITDVTHTNSRADYDYFARSQQRGELPLRVTMMGDASLDDAAAGPLITPGASKFHLHEHDLPDYSAFCGDIARSHRAGRAVAVHCVTVAELAFTLTALSDAGVAPGDRIEHAALVPDEWIAALRQARVTVVTQPNFIAERGDSYLANLPADQHAHLYRARSLIEAGIPVAAGTDAPFGDGNPWLAMQAAVERRTAAGYWLGQVESLSPESACMLYLGEPTDPGRRMRTVEAGAAADLCLLDRDWASARRKLAAVNMRMCLCAGEISWDSRRIANGLPPTPTDRRHSREDYRHALAL
jgi:predicted amidohydrolase YtcJ